jgi:excisionase family DNA binding protein
MSSNAVLTDVSNHARKEGREPMIDAKTMRPQELSLVRPRFARMKVACQYSGYGQSKMYELIRSGKIAAVKDGRTTLVDLDSVDRYHASLPKIGPRAAS